MEETTPFSPTSSFSYQIKVRHIPIKRSFDIIFSLCALVLASPLLLFITVLVLISSPGNIIYSQVRIGRGGRSFRMYKFRTMYQDASARLEEYLEKNPLLRREWEENFKLKNDPRVTPIGKFLRLTSMDELPQFINVLKGDLSVVGPRPVVKEEIDRFYGPIAHKVLSVRPGITGLWQVSGRSHLTYSDRVALDEKYVENQSMFLDLKLIIKTVPAILLSRGAY